MILRFFIRFHLILHLFGYCLTGYAQTPATANSDRITTDNVGTLKADFKALQTDLNEQKTTVSDASLAGEVADLLAQIHEQMRLREDATSRSLVNDIAVREAPVKLEKIRAEMQKSDSGTTIVEVPSTTSTERLSQWLEERKAELGTLDHWGTELDAEQERKSFRLPNIPRELAEVKSQLSAAEIASSTQPGTEDPLVARARSVLSRAQLYALRAQHEALEREQARYNAGEDFLPLGRALINERKAAYQQIIARQTERLNELRRKEADDSAREIKQIAREADKSHPLIRAIASENSSITEQLKLSGIVDEHDQIMERLSGVQAETLRISRQNESLRSKFNAVGYSDDLGLILRKQRSQLPNRRTQREALALQEKYLGTINLKSLDIQDQLNSLVDPSQVAADLLAEAGINDDDNTTAVQDLRREATRLLQARRDYLLKAREAYEKYFQTLVELNAAETNLLAVTTSYIDFINERILWLPSSEKVSFATFLSVSTSLSLYFSPAFWNNYFQAFINQVASQPLMYLMGVLLYALMLISRHQWKRKLSNVLHEASRNRLVAFRPVLKAFWYAAMFVTPVPLGLIFIGMPLADLYSVPIELASVASGIVRGGTILFVLLWTSAVIRKKGIAEVFFGWQESSLVKMRHTMAILVWIYIPAIIIVRMAQINDTDANMDAARLVLSISLVVVGLFFARLLRPRYSILLNTNVYQPDSWLYRLRYVIFVTAILGPIVMSAAALMGYIYTVIEIAIRLSISFWLGVGVLLLDEIIFFWILVKRRRLAIEEARKRREAAKLQKEAESGLADQSVAVPEPSLDIAAISHQAGRLLHVFVLGVFVLGLWGVWSGVLPALNYLDNQTVWSITRQAAVGTDGITQDVLTPVTLADLLRVVVIAFLGVVAIRNIPGLLDITVFQKFSVQAGERYAFNTLIRYVIIIVGLTYIFYKLGLQWKQIQWLAAAMTVGLGFGLQEIFANFVSGLILLFERPVRVGDTISVGEVSGRVTQIRIRATTIVNADHKEYLVPNKELITGKVLNWTLSDRMVRIVIKLNVAHGSDFELVRTILVKIAKENPYTMDDPAPQASIEQFGASSVEFSLSAQLPNLDHAGEVKHDIMSRIDSEFRAAGITIPFPQMTLSVTGGNGQVSPI